MQSAWHDKLLSVVQDVIARAGRFWGLYKRAGQRVMINPSGDLIVRPTFIEAAAQVMRPWGETLQLAHSYTGSPLTLDLPHEHVGHCLALMTAYFPWS